MKFDVLNRWTGKVQFTAEIECDENATYAVKLGLAVVWGVNNKSNLQSANLQSADLQSADLQSADLQYADLQSADLQSADLQSANLRYADLQSANLQSADLQSANLRYADLRYANLRSADLRYANLQSANLQSANLRYADLRYAIGNMSEVKSLQFEKWVVTYTHDTMTIGCQSHPIDLWRKSDPRWIAAMDEHATEWWGKFGTIILALIDASPAKKPELK